MNSRRARRGALRLVVGLGLALAAACAPANTAPRSLTVYAAASLTEALTEIGARFEAEHAGTRVVFNFGASNALAEQINQGAPADVFASANQKQMDAASVSGRIDAGSMRILARNRLVVVVPANNPAGVHALADLANPGLKLVLAAAEVPAGQYALDFLDKAARDPAFGAGFREAALANVVSYEETVRAVLTKVALGEADAGVVYASDVTGAGAANVSLLSIPAALNSVAVYPVAVLNDSAQAALAQTFVDFALSAEGQSVLRAHGFSVDE